MKYKSETLTKFKEFKAKVKNKIGKKIIYLYFDRGQILIPGFYSLLY